MQTVGQKARELRTSDYGTILHYMHEVAAGLNSILQKRISRSEDLLELQRMAGGFTLMETEAFECVAGLNRKIEGTLIQEIWEYKQHMLNVEHACDMAQFLKEDMAANEGSVHEDTDGDVNMTVG